MSASTRRLFVAGSTGATGKVLVPLAGQLGIAVVPHVRPASAAAGVQPGAAVVELADTPKVIEAMAGCTTVVQLIGTMRNRFARGDTYETSDIGTTAQLIAAARPAGVDHLVLLSSVGAGRPIGAYLKAKAKAEALVRESGIPWTIFRPSALEGGERKAIPGARGLTRLLGLKSFEPIALEELAAAMLQCAADRAPLEAVLEGASLWELVARARRP
ncbi:MAG: hypothetical protein H6Q89_3666 [Myxococcaceae bacterium]|nr:hypothetical protein [Myxococcaceae bacterium]